MRVNYSQKDKEYIKTEYLKGKTISLLAIEFAKDKNHWDSQKPRITKILKEMGVKIRGRNDYQKFRAKPNRLRQLNAAIKTLQDRHAALTERQETLSRLHGAILHKAAQSAVKLAELQREKSKIEFEEKPHQPNPKVLQEQGMAKS